MIYQTWIPNESLPHAERSVALGVFDGLHLGHRAVISAARNTPIRGRVLPTATVLSITGIGKSSGMLLTEDAERIQAATLGVDEWFNVPFESIRDLTPSAFVREILHEKLGAVTVCCGENYRFGKGGVGTAADLKTLCADYDIEVCIVPTVCRDGEVVSSTAVRQALTDGDPFRAMQLLGRPYTITYPVRAGNHLGSTWGVPTVNQPFPDGAAAVKFGVYASLVVIDGVQHRAVTNIGVHPTVKENAVPQAETFIAEYDGDLYDTSVSVQLIRFLREERKFASVEELKAQITEDITTADALLCGKNTDKAILFDFDDTLQHRPHAFMGAAKEIVRNFFSDLTEEEITARAETMCHENKDGYVDYTKFFESFVERWNWDIDVSSLWRLFRLRFPFHSELLPDVVPVLTELRRRGYRLGIITNGECTQQNLKLDAAGIRSLFDVVAVAGQEGVGKPHAEVFRRVAQRLCVAPENCVYVGDYPPNDFVGATAANMNPLYIDVHDRRYEVGDIPRVTFLTELLDLL